MQLLEQGCGFTPSPSLRLAPAQDHTGWGHRGEWGTSGTSLPYPGLRSPLQGWVQWEKEQPRGSSLAPVPPLSSTGRASSGVGGQLGLHLWFSTAAG